MLSSVLKACRPFDRNRDGFIMGEGSSVLEDPDPECDLDYIPKEGRNKRINYALSNSFGFGGINASLVLGRYSF